MLQPQRNLSRSGLTKLTHPTQQIGLFGGSFDPVHSGHLAVAHAVIDTLSLDELKLIPAAASPFKDQPHATDQQRLDMLDLAFDPANHPGISIDTRELNRPPPSYTIDTLRLLKQDLADARLFLILGQDAWLGFEKWHQWQQILDLVHLAVVNRPDAAPEPPSPFWKDRLKSDPKQLSDAGEVVQISMPPQLASSTDIRQRAHDGQELNSLVPPAVQRYIKHHQLYA